MQIIYKNEADAIKRRMYLQCFNIEDGITPETGEVDGQAEMSINGATSVETDGLLIEVDNAAEDDNNGEYYVQFTQAEVNLAHGTIIKGRYKSANTAPAIVIPIQIIDPQIAVNAIWDELLADHSIKGSAGRRLRNIVSMVLLDGTCPSAPLQTNQIILNGDASVVDGAYDPAGIAIIGGTGSGQTRLIYEYKGSTKTATVDRDWKIQPDDTSEYEIFTHPGREHVNEGLARGGGTNTIILNELTSDDDDTYKGQVVFIRSGKGADQFGKVIAYNGTSKEATVCCNWSVIPDATSAYVMLPTGAFNVVDVGSVGGTPVESGDVITGVFQNNVTVQNSDTQFISRGDTVTFTLVVPSDWNFTGKKVFFAMKANLNDPNSSAIVNREATVLTAQSASITLTAIETQLKGENWAEFEQRDNDGVSNPLTAQRFKVGIKQDVRQ